MREKEFMASTPYLWYDGGSQIFSFSVKKMKQFFLSNCLSWLKMKRIRWYYVKSFSFAYVVTAPYLRYAPVTMNAFSEEFQTTKISDRRVTLPVDGGRFTGVVHKTRGSEYGGGNPFLSQPLYAASCCFILCTSNIK